MRSASAKRVCTIISIRRTTLLSRCSSALQTGRARNLKRLKCASQRNVLKPISTCSVRFTARASVCVPVGPSPQSSAQSHRQYRLVCTDLPRCISIGLKTWFAMAWNRVNSPSVINARAMLPRRSRPASRAPSWWDACLRIGTSSPRWLKG